MEREPFLAAEPLDLIRRARSGEGLAFTELYKQYAGRVYAVCLRMLANETHARTLTQEIIVKAWQTIGTFRHECPFSAWLHRIAVNAALDFLRSEHRLASRLHFTAEPETFETASGVDTSGLSIDLEDAIAALAPQTRTVLVLHDVEGYRHQEIAGMLGIAVGTSKALLHRARTILKEKLQ